MSTCQKIVESDWESRDLSLLLWQLDKGTRSLWIASSKVVTVSGITSPVVDVHKSTFSYFYENPKIFGLMNGVYKTYVQLWLDNYCDKGSHREGKVKFFWTLFKRPLTPPPLLFEHLSFFAGGVFLSIKNGSNITMARMSSPHLKCCINVGFREAPCKKSFGILASYWTPPKIK